MKLPFGTNVIHKTHFLGKDLGDFTYHFSFWEMVINALKCLNEHEDITNMEALGETIVGICFAMELGLRGRQHGAMKLSSEENQNGLNSS